MSTESSLKVVPNALRPVETNIPATAPHTNQPSKPVKVWYSVSGLFSFQTVRDACVSIGRLPMNLFSLVERVFHAVVSVFFPAKEKMETSPPAEIVVVPTTLHLDPKEDFPVIRTEKMSDDTLLVSFFEEVECFAKAPPAKIRYFLKSRNVMCSDILSMSVNGKKLDSVPPEIRFLPLQELDISNNELTIFPSEIFSLSLTLKTLDLSDNFIERIPDEISSLINLKDLSLVNNKIKALPIQIGALRGLELLNVAQNKLESLPDIFGTMDALKELHVERNMLHTLPESLAYSLSLKGLYCTENQLTELPKIFGTLRLLEMCNLSNNLLTNIPDSINDCVSLCYLNIADNSLSSLPNDLSRLTRLTTLSLAKNKFSELPSSLLGLTSLSTLNLAGNPITALPEILYKIPSLKKVYIDEQQFRGWCEAIDIYRKKYPLHTISFWLGGLNPKEFSEEDRKRILAELKGQSSFTAPKPIQNIPPQPRNNPPIPSGPFISAARLQSHLVNPSQFPSSLSFPESVSPVQQQGRIASFQIGKRWAQVTKKP